MESPMRREFRYELKDGHAIKLGKMIYKDGQVRPLREGISCISSDLPIAPALPASVPQRVP